MSIKKQLLVLLAVCAIVGSVERASAEWLPTNVTSLTSWLNPADSGKITLSGSSITAFADSATGVVWGTGTAAWEKKDKPVYNANAFGTGKAGMVFAPAAGRVTAISYKPAYGDNADQGARYILTNDDTIGTITKIHGFLVVNASSSSPNKEVSLFGVHWGDMPLLQIYRANATDTSGEFRFYDGSAWRETNNNTGFSLNANHIVEFIYNGTATGTDRLKFYLDGADFGAVTATPNASLSVPKGAFYLGIQGGSESNPLAGKFGDTMFFKDVLSDADRNAAGYYLQNKYGISGTYVPEPGTMVLLALGLVGLLAYAWRKRK